MISVSVPFGNKTSAELWDAIEEVYIKTHTQFEVEQLDSSGLIVEQWLAEEYKARFRTYMMDNAWRMDFDSEEDFLLFRLKFGI